MSGAALMAGPYLVGIVVVDPVRYHTDRLLALPVAVPLGIEAFHAALADSPDLVDIGTEWRLAFGPQPDQSVRLSPSYRPIPVGFNLLANPYRLLDPQHKVVHIPGRETLVDELVTWAIDTPTPLALKTISGSGGSGKTRLAAEVCLSVAGSGWDAGFADFTTAGGETRMELERPTLIVIDDADLHFRAAGALVRATIYSAVPVRLLLLARSRSGWWKAFDSESDNYANGFDHGDLVLDDHTLDPDERRQLYRLAHDRFREELRVSPADAPEMDLSAPEFGEPLLLQLTALVAALGNAIDPARAEAAAANPRTLVLRAAVDREADRWVQTLATEQSLAENDRVVRRCVTTASLTNPHTADPDDDYQLEQAAVALLRAIPELQQADIGRLITLSAWLHTLHRGPTYWNPLRPDPLCDQLLADLDILPHLTEALTEIALSNNDATSLGRLLAELTRAAAASGGAAQRALHRILASSRGLQGGAQ
jgi:hypothetical protein